MIMDTMPNFLFSRLDCDRCQTRWAVLFDGNKYLYFDARYKPAMALYAVAGNPLDCPTPQCNGRSMRVIAYGALLTSEGEWLLLDKINMG